jgi:hypothetical protein
MVSGEFMIWHCEDCHTLGFSWDKTPEQLQHSHMKTCQANKTSVPDATGNDHEYWPEGSEI